ncbi:hypothetical protein [Sphingorhabdus sp. SMR4y]|uniref:hypothetical protein n=1 Tax=Sphingorhabdus sp. SMR4y TaxID=2584094 RepID=UPI000B5CA813|nr:hypothetical protein [Sphingorhabdus sp. SMR4y]ASK87657.1 hypothetical protein SPHFLASMR4Y_00877 [Sphingorhabdus sp. SMR4y]
MDFGSPEFVIAIIAVSYGGWIINNWIRAKHGYELEDEWGGKSSKTGPDEQRKIELLSNENAELVGKIDRLQERLQVLERIATDPAKRTADEIEALREKN